MMHWAAQYIGKPHEPGARGPDAYDCWGLLREVYHTHYGIDIPDIPIRDSNSALAVHRQMDEIIQEDWIKLEEPFDGCAIAMSQRHAYHHAGIYLAERGGVVLHCWDKHNVCIDTMSRIRLKGLRRITFYKHRLWPTS